MSGITTRKLFTVWFLFIVATLLGVVAFAGYNTITNSYDLSVGIAAAWETFGKWNLLVAAGGIVIITFIVHWANQLMDTTYAKNDDRKRSHRVVTVLGILAALIIAIIAAPYIRANLVSIIAVLVFLTVTLGLAAIALRGLTTAPHMDKIVTTPASTTTPVH